MSDVYVECLVQAKQSGLKKVLQVILIILTVLFCLGMILVLPLMIPLMILAIITGVASYLVGMSSQVEYEYLYLDRELTIDKIVAQSKRKKVATYTIDRLEVFAPVNSWHLDNFKNRNVKIEDYSNGVEGDSYCMYYEGGLKVILTPAQDMVKALKNVAPRKVFTD